MLAQEIDVLFGCIHSNGDRDKSLYPSRDVLDDGCFFWTGEWDSKMEDMFANLTKDILQGTAKFRTPGMWNEYFLQFKGEAQSGGPSIIAPTTCKALRRFSY